MRIFDVNGEELHVGDRVEYTPVVNATTTGNSSKCYYTTSNPTGVITSITSIHVGAPMIDSFICIDFGGHKSSIWIGHQKNLRKIYESYDS